MESVISRYWRYPGAVFAMVMFLFAGVLGLGQPERARASEELSVTASLATPEIAVGQVGELTVTVRGANSASRPDRIPVPGLIIQRVGESTRIEMNNFKVTSTVIYTYHIAAEREGTFEIPPIRIEAGGKTTSTAALTLRVSGQAQAHPGQSRFRQQGASQHGGQTSGGHEPAQNNAAPMAFAEWVFPKTTGYVGETIPAELRLYVASQVRWSLQQYPAMSGDGFTLQKLNSKPKREEVTRDGQAYDLVIFKTALTAVKAGKLVLEPTEIRPIMVLPRRGGGGGGGGGRSGLPRGLADMFDDPFFNNAFGAEPQQVLIKTEPVPIEIKPLPVAGRPKHFSGAVGHFTFETAAQPTKVAEGDPVTLTAKISGIGSFERMEAPVVEDEAGWKSYPPSSKFAADDEAGIAGTKTFDFALIPSSGGSEKRPLPLIEFSYFDPTAEKYVTLKGQPIEVTVRPSASAPATTAAASSGTASATPTPAKPAAAEPTQKPDDIHYIRLDHGSGSASFEPAWKTPLFWIAQGVAFLALLGWGLLRWRQTRPAPSGRSLLLKAKAQALQGLSSTVAKPFYDAAARVLQAETALKKGLPASSVETLGLREALSCRLDEETAAGVREIFTVHDEFRYSGGDLSTSALPADQVNRVRRILQQFDKSHA